MATFSKMHGLGNDFIILKKEDLPRNINFPELAEKVCNRRCAIGADGLIVVSPSDNGDIFWEMYNPDGTRVVEKCGNGLRCIALYYKKYIYNKKEIIIDSASGTVKAVIDGDNITVNIGKPSFNNIEIGLPEKTDPHNIVLDDIGIEGVAVAIGNPHFIFFDDQLNEASFDVVASKIAEHKCFKNGVNVQGVKVVNSDLHVLTWERNVGRTLACGSGGCAALIAAKIKKGFGSKSKVIFKGGSVEVDIRSSILLSGRAEESFVGEIEI